MKAWLKGWCVLILGVESAFSWSLAPGEATGIAAIDIRTGEVKWESYLPEHIPEAFRAEAMTHLFDWWKESQTGPPFEKPQTVDEDWAKIRLWLKLKQRWGDKDGAEFSIARDNLVQSTQSQNFSHYFILDGEKLIALPRHIEPGAEWKPDWEVQLSLNGPLENRMFYADHFCIWVVTQDKIIAVSDSGKQLAEFDVPQEVGAKFEGRQTDWSFSFFKQLAILSISDQWLIFDRVSGEPLFQTSFGDILDSPSIQSDHYSLDFHKISEGAVAKSGPLSKPCILAKWKNTNRLNWIAWQASHAPLPFQSFVENELLAPNQPFQIPPKTDFFHGRHGSHDVKKFTIHTRIGAPKTVLREEGIEFEGQKSRTGNLIKWASGDGGNSLFTFSDDWIVRRFEATRSAEGKPWGPKWEFDLDCDGVRFVIREEGLWVIGSERIVLLDPNIGDLKKDIAPGSLLAFSRGRMNAEQTMVQFFGDLMILSSHDTIVIDTQSAKLLWTYRSGFPSTYDYWSINPVPSRDGKLLFLPIQPTMWSAIHQQFLGGENMGRDAVAPVPEDPQEKAKWAVEMANLTRKFGDIFSKEKILRNSFEHLNLDDKTQIQIQKIAASHWPVPQSLDRLGDAVFERLNLETTPPSIRLSCLDLLVELTWRLEEIPPNFDPRDLCIRLLKNGSTQEQQLASQVLIRLRDRHKMGLPPDLVEELFIEKLENHREAVAFFVLSGERERAAELAIDTFKPSKKQGLTGNPLVQAGLIFAKENTKSIGEDEAELWISILKSPQNHSVNQLSQWFADQENLKMAPALENYLRETVSREAENPAPPSEKPTHSKNPFPAGLLKILATANQPEDNALFKKLLSHPGTKSLSRELVEFPVRKMAARILGERGRKSDVPADLELEKRVVQKPDPGPF